MKNGYVAIAALGAGTLFVGFWGCSDDAETTSGTGGGSTVSSTISSSVGPTSSSSGGSTFLGTPCNSDDQCTGGRCLKTTDNSIALGDAAFQGSPPGGAPGGYCTKDCTTDADCPGTGSKCIFGPGQSMGECFQGCLIGPQLPAFSQALDPNKCHGREDARCTELNLGPVCLPVCGLDDQCPGRACDPRSGLCVDTANTGKPTGAVCDESAANEDGCAGFCQTFSSDTGDPPDSICVSPCVLGGGYDFDCGGLDAGICVYRPTAYGAGDFGRCNTRCLEHADCGNPDWWCFDFFSDSDNGYCFTTDDCPAGDRDCGDPTTTGNICFDTPAGPKCLEFDPADTDCPAGPNCSPLFAIPGVGGAGGAGGNGGTGGVGGNGGIGGV